MRQRKLIIVLLQTFYIVYLTHGEREPRIINGSYARPKQFPYQVALSSHFKNLSKPFREIPSLCGGTIISKRWILTAAHCLEEPNAKLLVTEVTAGNINLMSRSGLGHVSMAVKPRDIIIHESFNRSLGTYDVALIKLPRDLKMNAYVKAAKLPIADGLKGSQSFEGISATTSGWGLVKGLKPIDKLQYVSVSIISNKQCEQAWNKQLKGFKKVLLKSMLCIDSGSGSPCEGDSGGPLVLNGKTNVIVGIVAHGFDSRCMLNVPDVYMRVSSFVDWIQQKTGGL